MKTKQRRTICKKLCRDNKSCNITEALQNSFNLSFDTKTEQRQNTSQLFQFQGAKQVLNTRSN